MLKIKIRLVVKNIFETKFERTMRCSRKCTIIIVCGVVHCSCVRVSELIHVYDDGARASTCVIIVFA